MSTCKSIFISYRLSDSSDGTGRIYERLCRDFEADSIFKDQASIKGGSSFWEVIEQAISDCQIMLVIMGPNWLTAKGEAGAGITNPEDWVRIDITNDRRFGNDMDDLVGRLEELIGASLISRDSGICPYKGLEFFDCNDEDPKYNFGGGTGENG